MNDTVEGIDQGDDYETTLAVDLLKKDTKTWNKVDCNNIRQNMSNLRKRLQLYFNAEGAGDPIIIEFPKRSGYAATCKRRPITEDQNTILWLGEAASHAFPDRSRYRTIALELDAYVVRQSSYAPAYAIIAEVALGRAICNHPDITMTAALSRAEEAINVGMALHNGLWRMHVLTGAIQCWRDEWQAADQSFKTAYRLDADETRGHVWYAVFMIATGRYEEAARTIRRQVDRPRLPLKGYMVALLRWPIRLFQHMSGEIDHARPVVTGVWDRTRYILEADIREKLLESGIKLVLSWIADALDEISKLDASSS